jgi:hypothetical protein
MCRQPKPCRKSLRIAEYDLPPTMVEISSISSKLDIDSWGEMPGKLRLGHCMTYKWQDRVRLKYSVRAEPLSSTFVFVTYAKFLCWPTGQSIGKAVNPLVYGLTCWQMGLWVNPLAKRATLWPMGQPNSQQDDSH